MSDSDEILSWPPSRNSQITQRMNCTRHKVLLRSQQYKQDLEELLKLREKIKSSQSTLDKEEMESLRRKELEQTLVELRQREKDLELKTKADRKLLDGAEEELRLITLELDTTEAEFRRTQKEEEVEEFVEQLDNLFEIDETPALEPLTPLMDSDDDNDDDSAEPPGSWVESDTRSCAKEKHSISRLFY